MQLATLRRDFAEWKRLEKSRRAKQVRKKASKSAQARAREIEERQAPWSAARRKMILTEFAVFKSAIRCEKVSFVAEADAIR